MAKAVLVMDMPDSCNDCFFYCFDEGTHKEYCSLEGSSWKVDTDGDKPDWCPLISEPERADENNLVYNLGNFVSGWNACLDVLEGKENE